MNYNENDGEKNINSILGVVKLGVLYFSIIIILYRVIHNGNSILNIAPQEYIHIILYIFTPIMLVMYLIWSYFYLHPKRNKYCKNMILVENLVFITLFTILILISGAYKSQFKFLFLFVIISSIIQLGSKIGLLIASISSVIVLTIDLIFAPSASVNIYFENDIILAGSLVLAAWALGRYSELQNENLNKKTEQLQILNIKLTEQELKRKQIEKMIFNSEICYNLLINNSNDAIFVHRNNKLIFSNDSAAKLTGFQLSTLSNTSIMDFVPENEKCEIENKYSSIYRDETGVLSFEQRINIVDGTTVAVKNTSTCFIYEGQATILTILRDITSEKQVLVLEKDVERNVQLLNETREYNKFITDFFSNISHELKTPLNIIFSSVQLLAIQDQDKLMQNKDKYLKIMKQNCYRLTRLINNLLDITRADAGFLVPHMKNCNIISVVEDITMSVVDFAENKGIELIFDTNCEEKIIALDPDKLERIILNLLSNALKFTNPNGQIVVNMLDEGDYVKISVKDTGIGIPEDKLNFIFERFRQVDKTFTRNHEGSGIGLSLVKSFVEMHGGMIEAKSHLGKGSEFTIQLPVKLCDDNLVNENLSDDRIIERASLEFSDIYS
ncbi:ATP-binding protein [Clostridium swellfunianum]|uniref:PAS domain-containing sensor histidine kinase n=1 Tax=Clostridium swellfunianum TaxID=1367462 RepID=UPI002030CB56|nr:ATP-binding protein [Clostridium swellfunianum]MCM0648009.1 ATP-binding protein [Clostridium swellfunianum]